MKRIFSFLLAVMLLVSALPVAYAADTQDYSLGTAVVYTADEEANENWTVTVPAKLAPGTGGTVTLEGYWPSNKTITVTAQESVKLTNSINANDTKTLAVDFKNGISAAGSNTEKQKFTETVSVEAITNALFGTWDGHFYYTVGTASAPVLEGDGQTFYTLAPSTLSFRSTAPLSEFQEVQINGVTVDPSNYTLTEGSTIVTLSIDYLKTLDESVHQITVVSNSGSPSAGFEVVAPEPSINGLYYNQPYTIEYDDGSWASLLFATDGNAYPVTPMGIYAIVGDTIPYTYNKNGVYIEELGKFAISSDGMQLTWAEDENEVWSLGTKTIVSDEDYIYVYNKYTDSYNAQVIDRAKFSYNAIRTGVNDCSYITMACTYLFCSNLTAYEVPCGIENLNNTFYGCKELKSLTIPTSVIKMEAAFGECYSLTNIIFEGTMAQWNDIEKGSNWNQDVPATEVICSDGTVALS